MKVIPLSFDSMGVRSMATYVETRDVKVLIDPGVSLAPLRYGLPPHRVEIEKMNQDWLRIVEYAMNSQVLIVTHYHYDHHNPNESLKIFTNKVVLVKHPKKNINYSQMRRASYFLSQIEGLPSRIEYADGEDFSFGKTLIRFSKPVYHGVNSKLGYVVETLIDDGESRFVHTSDVEGPSMNDQVEFILNHKPRTVFIDGPMSYMLGYRYSVKSLEKSIENLLRVIDECPVKELVLDHHLLRELNWSERVKEVIEYGSRRGVRVVNAAEYLGVKPSLLEARRRELYEELK